MYEVETQRKADLLLEHYIHGFELRYGTKPMDISAFETTFLKDLVHRYGIEKAKDIVEGFLRSSHEWFKRKSHSLLSLKGNIDVVNVELASKISRPSANAKTIRSWVYCDSKGCDALKFEFTVPINNDFDTPHYCEKHNYNCTSQHHYLT